MADRSVALYRPVVATVLVVEDDDDAAEVMGHALRKAGYRVFTAPTGRAALSLLLGGGVDLVVTDLRMPEMDGVSLVAVMRSYLRFKSMPVIVFTAFGEDRGGDELRRMGVREVFRKADAHLEDLVRAVGRHLAPPTPTQSPN